MFIISGRNIRTMARVYYTGRAGDCLLYTSDAADE